jgi:hypothetical protein
MASSLDYAAAIGGPLPHRQLKMAMAAIAALIRTVRQQNVPG